MYKGIILAGGRGTRLYPMTQVYNKHLIHIYDKPMIYYPLSLLMIMGIKDILIISDYHTLWSYMDLLGNPNKLGLNIDYARQEKPRGIADSFNIAGSEWIGDDNVVLVLGDNIFYGDSEFFTYPLKRHKVATIFAYYVNDPTEYGVVEFDNKGKAISLEEKPKEPKSNYAIPGLYIYDNSVLDVVKNIQPSDRGELEITDVNQVYLDRGDLVVDKLGRGIAWLDTGSPKDLLEAGNFFAAIENRQGLKIGCVEEIAFRRKLITKEHFENLIDSMPQCDYRSYLEKIINE